ncbi:threonine aldolase [Elizabethkingia meningoseptica]|uniref:Threonine aldolase n=2 Tax=Elizabethkingia meningoseptica TaxID=238 RepID=A0A1T3FGE8_ELIME|nr:MULTISPECIES: GntG family PLP-dependent aldolase [Elizabethkingia]AQX12936.1 threonine aldolase [Elizabethkingia meningoseptica]MBG0514465.1 aminotransferase class I/II-fold pyridoxal phosphate-dependent enzyme [Elizabethkingia meningoseptica]MDE5430979.1 aminotransferase class I/II-fold pyridoxal phosphate-dependent enzyme [Elizabethkingia meningoseptica]MDE5433380.1 aminotransferase class I/II-fold pyridoxal phosphate-dependent enzyme [Elizabethkingia meningoseptica]MDE5471255.1 aminotran
MKAIDLRSDTLTQPTPGMREAMQQALLGDDVYREDPTVNKLEEKAAKMFGMEAALFCPTGTMTNQLAIKVHTRPGDEVICDKLSHIYLYEGGGIAMNAFSSVRPLDGAYGKLSAAMVQDAVNNPDDIHQPITRLVALENTTNKGGGSIYDFNEIKKIKQVCTDHNLILHLDGARLFNALIETQETPEDYGNVFDSISICLSKGLGCPVGSLLIGTREFIEKARRARKAMGGGWRQAGGLAAAGVYALDHHIPLLKEDHRRAKEVGKLLLENTAIQRLYPVESNIVIGELPTTVLATDFVSQMKENNILCSPFGKHLVRFVTHLDFTDDDLSTLENLLKD